MQGRGGAGAGRLRKWEGPQGGVFGSMEQGVSGLEESEEPEAGWARSLGAPRPQGVGSLSGWSGEPLEALSRDLVTP